MKLRAPHLLTIFRDNAALRVSLIYAGLSVLWILFSDQILFWFVKNSKVLATIEMLKGWFFVITTAVIIFYLLRTEISRLKGSENLLWATLHATADGILVVSNEGSIMTANKRFADMWGFRPGVLGGATKGRALIGHILDRIEAPEGLRGWIAAVNRNTADAAEEIRLRNGKVFECHTRPLIQSGRPVGRVWSFHDLTERKRTNRGTRISEQG